MDKAIGQTDLDERLHRHQDTTSLGRMSFAVLHAFFSRAEAAGKLNLSAPLAEQYRHFMRQDGVTQSIVWDFTDLERPPLREVPGYAVLRER